MRKQIQMFPADGHSKTDSMIKESMKRYVSHESSLEMLDPEEADGQLEQAAERALWSLKERMEA